MDEVTINDQVYTRETRADEIILRRYDNQHKMQVELHFPILADGEAIKKEIMNTLTAYYLDAHDTHDAHI